MDGERNTSAFGSLEQVMKQALAAMGEAAFDDRLLETMMRECQAEWEREDFTENERDYADAKEHLPKLLSQSQLDEVERLEQLYTQEAKMCLELAFRRGIYAAFQHCFDLVNKPCKYENLVLDQLTLAEGMERYPEYAGNRKEINRLAEKLTDELDPFRGEYLTGLICAWDERTFGMLRYGFRLGYFAAQSLMLEINPFLKLRLSQTNWKDASEIDEPFL